MLHHGIWTNLGEGRGLLNSWETLNRHSYSHALAWMQAHVIPCIDLYEYIFPPWPISRRVFERISFLICITAAQCTTDRDISFVICAFCTMTVVGRVDIFPNCRRTYIALITLIMTTAQLLASTSGEMWLSERHNDTMTQCSRALVWRLGYQL
jgi:hypothetical protein